MPEDAVCTRDDGDAPLAFRVPLVLRSTLRRWPSLIGMIAAVGGALGVLLLLVALAEGSYRMMVEDYEVTGVDLYVLQRGGVLLPILPGDDPGTLRGASRLLAQVRRLPGVRTALGIATRQVERTREGPARDRRQPPEIVTVVGVEGPVEQIDGALMMHAGRWPQRAEEVVVGSKLAHDRALGVGNTITLEHRRLTIVGIGRLRGVGLGGFGSGAYAFVEYKTLRDMARLGDEVDTLMVDAADPAATVVRLQAELDGIDTVDRAGVEQAVATLAEHDIVFMRIAGAMGLFIAAVFVASMLARSVSERRAEFATLSAIGVPGRTLAGLVLIDAVVVTGMAMPLGLLIANVVGEVVNTVYAEWLDIEQLYRLTAGLVAPVLGVTMVVGLVAGFVPARAAMRAEPAEVLRDV